MDDTNEKQVIINKITRILLDNLKTAQCKSCGNNVRGCGCIAWKCCDWCKVNDKYTLSENYAKEVADKIYKELGEY